MPPPARRGQPANLVIDLTNSDDEDDQSLGTRQLPQNHHASQMAQNLPASNDGLPRFDFGETSIHSRCDAYDLSFAPQHSGSNPRSSKPLTYFAHAQKGAASRRRSSRELLARDPNSASRRGTQIGENTSKRRKTDGRAILRVEVPFSSYAVTQSRVSRTVEDSRSRSDPEMRSESRPKSSAIRQDPARKLKGREGEVRKVNVEERKTLRIRVLLQDTVFPYIRAALGRYQDILTRTQRAEIGQQIAAAITRDPLFVKDITSNDISLSKAYKSTLPAATSRMASKLVKEILAESEFEGPEPLTVGKELPAANPPRKAYSVVKFGSPESSRSSSESEEEAQIFDSQPSQPSAITSRAGVERRKCSSSPATSFSTRNTSQESDNAEDSTDARPDVRKRRSLRAKAQVSASKPVVVTASNAPAPAKSKPSEKVPRIRQARQTKDTAIPTKIPFTEKPQRPYKKVADRENQEILDPEAHIDFSIEEVEYLCATVKSLREGADGEFDDQLNLLSFLLSGKESLIPRIWKVLQQKLNVVESHVGQHMLRYRKESAIVAFLEDAANGRTCTKVATEQGGSRQVPALRRLRSSLNPALRYREIHGLMPPPGHSNREFPKVRLMTHLEDSMTRQTEWMDCCGDISTFAWTGENAFICGAIAHSDYHNMQYNKPGNLLLGSLVLDTLRSYPEHKIIRPVIGSGENAENALEAMRRTQDPWLYTSVVSTSHSKINGYTFTASFDNTVKVWTVSDNGESMKLQGTWNHDNKVNFAITSCHHNRIATAADVINDAIRVYNLNEADIENSEYDIYNGERAMKQALEGPKEDTWAYFPATIQWGRAKCVSNLLLVGYSPRSISGDDVDIPDDEKNTGELCLWDVETKERIMLVGTKHNVFEVMWHPTEPAFLAATSTYGLKVPKGIKTQIRIFSQNLVTGVYSTVRILDCSATDINELTFRPTSRRESYVTASCTDGKTYVWDTFRGENPIHVLEHGESLDNPPLDLDRQTDDAGVMFAAWGQNVNRFYTGSSDGKLKAWNIREGPGRAFVRNVLELSGGISAGAFSPDMSKLVIGDATGKVHLLGFDEDDLAPEPTALVKSVGGSKPSMSSAMAAALNRKRPNMILHHPEPPAPSQNAESNVHVVEQTAKELAELYLTEGQLTIHSKPGIGAVQGPNYEELDFFRREAHEEEDAMKPLLPGFQKQQQYELAQGMEKLRISRLPLAQSSEPQKHATHVQNEAVLIADGCDMRWNPHFRQDIVRPSFAIFEMDDPPSDSEDEFSSYEDDISPYEITNGRKRSHDEMENTPMDNISMGGEPHSNSAAFDRLKKLKISAE
ncbi:hypothetical protein B0J14DRAFT_545349 [Halenospora varia]|nr:hypothetical protein B0J14DRAFT_545349 [Halenospora varia]